MGFAFTASENTFREEFRAWLRENTPRYLAGGAQESTGRASMVAAERR
jgi:hypothetical protein